MLNLMGKKILTISCSNLVPKKEVREIEVKRLRKKKEKVEVCLFVFVALRPMSTAMVIAGRSVHLTTLFPGQA